MILLIDTCCVVVFIQSWVLPYDRVTTGPGFALGPFFIADVHMDLRGGRNADLVFALAIALWWGDKLTWHTDISKINPLAGGRSRGANSWMGA